MPVKMALSLFICIIGISSIYCATIPVTQTSTGLPTTECKDNQDNCFSYGDEQCVGRFAPWAQANCAYRCGYCPGNYPPCEDTIDYCAQLGSNACTEKIYQGFIRLNCRKYCNKCTVPALNYTGTSNNTTGNNVPTKPSETGRPTVETTGSLIGDCKDRKDNCFMYDDVKCLGIYEPWARDNCAYRCGYCPDKPPCVDKNQYCEEYGDNICTEPSYAGWTRTNCRKYCSKCEVPYKGNETATITLQTSTVSSTKHATPPNAQTGEPSSSTKHVTPPDAHTGEPPRQPTTPKLPMVTYPVLPTGEACKDVRSDCDQYGDEACEGVFKYWAMTNCAGRCGYCTNDKLSCADFERCDLLPHNVCTAPEYRDIAITSCRRFCGFCLDNNTSSELTSHAPTSISPSIPMIMSTEKTTIRPIVSTDKPDKVNTTAATEQTTSVLIQSTMRPTLPEPSTQIPSEKSTAIPTPPQPVKSSTTTTPTTEMTSKTTMQPTPSKPMKFTTMETTSTTTKQTTVQPTPPKPIKTTIQPVIKTTQQVETTTVQPDELTTEEPVISTTMTEMSTIKTNMPTQKPVSTVAKTTQSTPPKPVSTAAQTTQPTPPKPVSTAAQTTQSTPPKVVSTMAQTTQPTPPKPVSTMAQTTQPTPPKPVSTVAQTTQPTPPKVVSTMAQTTQPTPPKPVSTVAQITPKEANNSSVGQPTPSPLNPGVSHGGPTPSPTLPTFGISTQPPEVCYTNFTEPVPACCKVCSCPGDEVFGRVIDQHGEPVANAQVSFSGCDCVRYLTDPSGNYVVRDICVQGHEMFYLAAGYMPSKMLPVPIVKGGKFWKADNILVEKSLLPALNVTEAPSTN